MLKWHGLWYNFSMVNKNKKTKQAYRIGIDARFFGLENKGLGRYTNELIEGLDKILLAQNNKEKININKKYNIEYYIFLKNANYDKYQPKSKNIYKVKANYKWYSWEEQIKFPILLKKYKLDLMHFTHFNVPILYFGKTIVTIHDLILFHYPTVKNTSLGKGLYLIKLMGYHFVIRIVTKRASVIVAISKFTKQDIIKTLKISKHKIKVIYEGAEFGNLLENSPQASLVENFTSLACGEFSSDDVQSQILKKYGIMKSYLLYVGNAYPHKNLERLVLAFNKINNDFNSRFQLVLIGRKDYFYNKLGNFIVNKKISNIIITDYISDKELVDLYRNAELFVFPSLYEGFGLPPLEALIKKIPVVSSNKGSLPEILEDKVVYFNPESIEMMYYKIKKVLLKGGQILNDKEVRIIKKKYSWQNMVKEIVNIYEVIINK